MQLSLPLIELETSVEDMTDEEVRAYGRRLALATLIFALADAKGISDCEDEDRAEARVAVDLEMRYWLVELGLPRAAHAPMHEILDFDEDALARGLAAGSSLEHCRNCIYLQVEGARCRCALDHWKGMGLRAEYAHTTVYHDDGSRFYCRDFVSRRRA